MSVSESPEQTEAGTVDEAADVWALGLLAFYILTGRCFWKIANGPEMSLPRTLRRRVSEEMKPSLVPSAAYTVEIEPCGFGLSWAMSGVSSHTFTTQLAATAAAPATASSTATTTPRNVLRSG